MAPSSRCAAADNSTSWVSVSFIGILHSVGDGVSRRHRRSPAVAMKPAEQDPESVDCAQGPRSNALLAAEIQSFLDHLLAGFRQSRASNDAPVRPLEWKVRPADDRGGRNI